MRTQAAKALRLKGELTTLEVLLSDPDPRLRRTDLDGINDGTTGSPSVSSRWKRSDSPRA